jgi:hypothetical protein
MVTRRCKWLQKAVDLVKKDDAKYFASISKNVREGTVLVLGDEGDEVEATMLNA